MNKFFLATVLLALGFLTCAKDPIRVAGGGTDSPNASVTARVVRADGSPAAGLAVRLRRSDYVAQPQSSLLKSAINNADTVTDALGQFELTGVDSGTYDIEAFDSGSALLFTCSIASSDSINLGTGTLQPFGAVHGSIDTSGTSGKRLFVQVLGLERIVSVDSTEAYLVDDLPAGLFSLRIIGVSGSQTTAIRSDQVSTIPGDTVSVTMPGWGYAKKIHFNTTTSGANVPGNVANFPVLIRLTNKTFDFSQASPVGADIRFMKQNNSPLPYEIERWDAVAQAAEIWVRADTIYGNDSAHYISMCWGNPRAANMSDSPTVFDTAGGFQAVWHMAEPSGTAPDATPNHFNGTPSTPAPVQAIGIIGNCQQFNGTSNYITAPGTASGPLNFSSTANYSVSAWVYVDTLDTLFQKIVEKNNVQYKLQIDQFKSWSFSELDDANEYEMTNAPASAKEWVYVAGVRAGAMQYLYVNGQCVNSTITYGPYSGTRDTATDVVIGNSSGNPFGCFFKGKIDEVRIQSTACSADWIKLCAMNQKADDALITIRK